MSRSYKKTPVSKWGGRAGGTRKYWKRQANRKVRKNKIAKNKSKHYKRVFESWNIRDYRFYKRNSDFQCEEGLVIWEKYYHRK